MNNLTLAAQTIKDTISAQEAARMMGLEVQHGRCKCPIHGGTDYNCVVYSGDRGFYCHVCKVGGDVIKFVQIAMFGGERNGSFKNAVEWFNSSFKLGLDLDGQIDKETLRRASEEQIRRKNDREQKEREERKKFDTWLAADKMLEQMEEQRDENVPKTPNEEWNDRFCEAVRKIPGMKRIAQKLYFDCIEVKK